jgi:hypothetical protein
MISGGVLKSGAYAARCSICYSLIARYFSSGPLASSPIISIVRFPPPWRADPTPGGYVVRDVNGQALAYLYSRDNPTEAPQAKMLTKDEARRIAVNIARRPELLHRENDSFTSLLRSLGGLPTRRAHR